MTRILGRKPPLILYQQRAAGRFAVVVCSDLPAISCSNPWSGAPAIETSVASWLVRLQTATRSDSGSCALATGGEDGRTGDSSSL